MDHVFTDNMENEFNELVGAWPESYFITNPEGVCLWSTSVTKTGPQSLIEAGKFAQTQGFLPADE